MKVALHPGTGVLIRDRRGDTQTQEKPHGHGGSDGRDKRRATCSPQTLAEAGKSLPWSLGREQALPRLDVRRLVSRTWTDKFLWLSFPLFVAISLGSYRKLIHRVCTLISKSITERSRNI